MKRIFFLLCILLPLWSIGQILPTKGGTLRPINGGNTFESDPNAKKRDRDRDNNVKIEGEKPPIKDYKIISQSRDTTHVDTTLSMAKDYKFNYLRKDNFERLAFANIGQPYTELAKRFDMDLLTPRLGARARHLNYFEIDDVYDYYVPTPLTELYFKTTITQGQQLDAFFTTNISRQFNFSISYKGVRSIGRYLQSIVSTGNFKLSSNYTSKNNRYRLRLHFTAQDLSNENNGGLQPEFLQSFLDNDPDYDNRDRLEVNLDDAVSVLDGKRYYINHDYEIVGNKDSTSLNSLRIYNTMFYEDKFFKYEEAAASNSFLGPSYTGSNLRGVSDLEEGAVELGASYENNILGYLQAGVARRKYNYGYDRALNLSTGFITNRLIDEVYQFKASYNKTIGAFNFKSNLGLNVAGDVDGNYVNASAEIKLKNLALESGISVNSRAPDFNYLLHQSDYILYNWQNEFNNIKKQELFFKMKSQKFVDIDLLLYTLQDYTYFSERRIADDTGVVTGYTASPQQSNDAITYIKLKVHKDIKYKVFGLDNTLMYQEVDQTGDLLNVPSFVTRNSLYYKDRWFKKALQVQTGVTFNYFTKYYMDGYDPVLGDFYSQNSEKLGGFPRFDLFFNAKVRQTRIFFKAEHFNALFSKPNYFNAPRKPYRDFVIRFGIVWNFFL